MATIGLFWGSTSGNTEDAATRLAQLLELPDSDVYDIGDTSPAKMLTYDVIIVGSSTWDIGELQHDWSIAFDDIEGSFAGKTMAFFGCGDQFGYPANFVDAIGILWERFASLGAGLIGKWPSTGYDFTDSLASLDEGANFVGLALDYDNEDERNEERLSAWARQLKEELTSVRMKIG